MPRMLCVVVSSFFLPPEAAGFAETGFFAGSFFAGPVFFAAGFAALEAFAGDDFAGAVFFADFAGAFVFVELAIFSRERRGFLAPSGGLIKGNNPGAQWEIYP